MKIEFQVDHVDKAITRVHQNDVGTDHEIPVAARAGRKFAQEPGRAGPAHPDEFGCEHVAVPQPIIVFPPPAAVFPEVAVVLVMLVIDVRFLTVVIVESGPAMFLSASAMPVPVVAVVLVVIALVMAATLRRRRAASEGKKRSGAFYKQARGAD